MIETNKQEIFNKAYLGLASQNFAQSCSLSSSCAYRGVDVLKCAVGHLIDDNDYDPDWDQSIVSASDIPVVRNMVRDDPEMLDFMNRLQIIHDENDGLVMKNGMDRFAEENGLIIPNIESDHDDR